MKLKEIQISRDIKTDSFIVLVIMEDGKFYHQSIMGNYDTQGSIVIPLLNYDIDNFEDENMALKSW